MDLEKYDVVIVGGGPVGCITGESIKNHNVLIVEEHQSIGVPLQCAGLVSKRGSKELGDPKGCVNKIRGAYIHAKGTTLNIGNEEIRAYVYERKVMDKDIAIRASKHADFLLKTYGRIKIEKNKYKLILNHMGEEFEIFPKIIIGSDGTKSTIGKSIGLINNKNREILSSCQFEMVDVDIDDDFVHVFIDKDYSREFFIWIIPMGKDRVRVGLCDKGNCYKKLVDFINNHPIAKEMLKNATTTEFSVGALPIGYSKTVKDNVLLVGDAAGQVKPLTGGGLYYGARCAKICGEIVDKYLSNDYDLDYLKNYEKLWKREIGREIDIGLKIRKIFLKMNNNQIEKILNFIKNSGLIEYINEHGDMDKPSYVVKHVFENYFKGFLKFR
ncbi:geranylgeranyl reductase family protein [Methanotorris formicicus]|uniref:Geranylgeranyl reductase n=1 Tax=Methanotorris formicicus Mc-S-70 TaxID=647171 RepID=H1L0I8_9EURY|nr:geranylgeranyl reductase family protein [Methanotorris formicicus]EHP84820.1 geranylgeranyl reductase [Methanotorris formicicus Mc-S-70]